MRLESCSRVNSTVLYKHRIRTYWLLAQSCFLSSTKCLKYSARVRWDLDCGWYDVVLFFWILSILQEVVNTLLMNSLPWSVTIESGILYKHTKCSTNACAIVFAVWSGIGTADECFDRSFFNVNMYEFSFRDISTEPSISRNIFSKGFIAVVVTTISCWMLRFPHLFTWQDAHDLLLHNIWFQSFPCTMALNTFNSTCDSLMTT